MSTWRPITELLALDRGSVRSYDEDGRMRVEMARISKAGVNEYLGDEIPHWSELGLQPDKRYRMLRHPDEMAKAADTFNLIPLMMRHIQHTADDHGKLAPIVVGSVGAAAFDGEYMNAPLIVLDRGAIDGIKQDAIRELSASYHYDPEMVSGEWNGQAYDGVMRNLRGNHVILTERGRAGRDCCVGDQALPDKDARKFITYGSRRFVPASARRFMPAEQSRQTQKPHRRNGK